MLSDMNRYLLYDIFCGAGGSTKGYRTAGFRVIGIDNKPQSRYCGDGFIQMDAFEFLRRYQCGMYEEASIFHSSPPCQAHTALKSMWNAREHPDLIPQTREALRATGKPYVIENVPGAPLDVGLMLCGSMFGLCCDEAELRRHRLFESNVLLYPPGPCNHGRSTISVVGHSSPGISPPRGKTKTIHVTGHSPTNGTQHSRTITVAGSVPRDSTLEKRRYSTITVTGAVPQQNVKRNEIREIFSVAQAQQAMGIDWMPMSELSQAIPPAYTQWIGDQLRQYLNSR